MHKEKYKGFKIKLEADEDINSPREEYDNLATMVCFHNRHTLGDSDHGYHQHDYNSWADLRAQIEEDHGEVIILPLYLFDHSGLTMNTTGFSCPWDSGHVGFIFCSKERFRKETGYTEDELFNPDARRTPKVGERVKVKSSKEWAMVKAIDAQTVTVDFFHHYSKEYLEVHMPELDTDPQTFPLGEIAEVMASHAEEMLRGEVETYDQFLRGDVWGYTIKGVYNGDKIKDSCWGFYGQAYCLEEAKSQIDSYVAADARREVVRES